MGLLGTDALAYGAIAKTTRFIKNSKAAGAVKKDILEFNKKQFNRGNGQRGGIGGSAGKKAKVEWSAYNNKHAAPKGKPWKEVVKSTKNGPAKYSQNLNGPAREALERKVWSEGTPVTNGKTGK